MCGFLYLNHLRSEYEEEILDKYKYLSEGRGPDETSVLARGNELFVFSRLAINSFGSVSIQPFQNGDDITMFNGEIYDYDKNIYNSDTEFVADVVQQKKLNAITEFSNYKGFFAVVHSDGNSVHLHRDFLGKKPLYYGYSEYFQTFYACSSLELSIFLSKIKSTDRSYKNMMKKLTRRIYYTLFDDNLESINEVKPGSSIRIDLATSEVAKNYYPLFGYIGKFTSDFSLRSRLESSARVRYEEKVSTTIALSGGIDSGLIAFLSKSYVNSAYFVDTGDELELERATIASKSNDIELNILKAKEYELTSKFFITHLNSSMLNYVAKESSSSHRVILVGEGADELFLGYGRNRLIKYFNNILVEKCLLKSRLFCYLIASVYFSTVTFPYVLTYHEFCKAHDLFLEFDSNKSQSSRVVTFFRLMEIALHQRPLIDRVDSCFTNNSIEARAIFLDPEVLDFALNHSQYIGKLEPKKVYSEIYPSINNLSKQGLNVMKSNGLMKRLKEKILVKRLNTKVYKDAIR